MRIMNGSTPTIVLFLVDATDGETPETELSPTVYISKNGGAGAATANSAVEIDSVNMPGLYAVQLTAAETDTDGPLVVRCHEPETKLWLDIHEIYSVAETAEGRNMIADHVLKRPFSSAEASSDGDGGTSPGKRTLMAAAAKDVNRVRVNGAAVEIYLTDDTTVWFQQAAVAGSGSPISEQGGAS